MKQAAIALAFVAGGAMANEASGSFEVRVKPVAGEMRANDSRGRMVFDKTFSGGLTGKSDGEMLTAGSPSTGSGGYVALERFEGKLDGRDGSFVMQHSGVMESGKYELDIKIVPDSGTGQLIGIRGSAKITITGGQHFYTLSYTLP
jgi:hypothetical protein